MAENRGRNARINAFLGFFNQFVILALGLVIPRLVLVNYGSEANGLLTTVTQIFTYVALLEAGIGNAAINAFYKPIVEQDKDGICDVFSATQKYFRKVTLIYAICVIVISFSYPLVVASELGYGTIFWVIFFQGMSGVVTFYFSAAYRQLLIADGKYYIISTIHLIIYILSSTSKIILMSFGVDIVFLQVLNFVITCIQIIMFICVMRKRYGYLKKVSDPNMAALAERKAFVVHEVSSTIFSSTDALVLSTFCSLKVASVYTVYNMVFTSLSSLINSVNNGLNYILGHVYAKNDPQKYEIVHDAYESIYMMSVFAIFTVAYILILPFVSLYTSSVVDIQYVDELLPILFVAIQLLSCSRAVASRLITISGHAKATQVRSIIEACINLVVSIVLVNLIGIYGVLLGTIVALLYRSNDIIIYSNKKILKRSPFCTYKKMLVYLSIFAIVVFLCKVFKDSLISEISNYFAFIIYGIVCTPLSIIIYAFATLLVDKNVRGLIVKKIKK
ncbi:MAG: sugar isomerase [Clostridia bacterium]|nr:sugar isomerase [Clostridia bacterium]